MPGFSLNMRATWIIALVFLFITSRSNSGESSHCICHTTTQRTGNPLLDTERCSCIDIEIHRYETELKEALKYPSLKNPKYVFDFASSAAGAMVIETSSYVEGASNVLNKDPDKYLLFTCSEQEKYFVIQLSEDIAVSQFQVENLEHYSGSVEHFKISSSALYPTQQWLSLGEFIAKDTVEPQFFENVIEPETTCRYIKFEWLTSHRYSDEYYCTITSFKVFGARVIEDLHIGMSFDPPEVEVGTAERVKNSDENLVVKGWNVRELSDAISKESKGLSMYFHTPHSMYQLFMREAGVDLESRDMCPLYEFDATLQHSSLSGSTITNRNPISPLEDAIKSSNSSMKEKSVFKRLTSRIRTLEAGQRQLLAAIEHQIETSIAVTADWIDRVEETTKTKMKTFHLKLAKINNTLNSLIDTQRQTARSNLISVQELALYMEEMNSSIRVLQTQSLRIQFQVGLLAAVLVIFLCTLILCAIIVYMYYRQYSILTQLPATPAVLQHPELTRADSDPVGSKKVKRKRKNVRR